MSDQKYVLKREEIEEMPGVSKQHFLNSNAKRVNKSLGDITGLTGLGFHIIEVPPGCESTEYHLHHHEDECIYILSGMATVTIGDEEYNVSEGDFIGYRAGGKAHSMRNTGSHPLRCIVVGQRLDHDVGDYPNKNKRLYRNKGLTWDLASLEAIEHPKGGKK